MAVELIDELEAGELSVELEGEEPQVVLEWALERFAPRIALSTALQIDGVALLDMAYEIDPDVRVFTVDTGRLPEETFELVERLLERYPGLGLEHPRAGAAARAEPGRQARPEPLLPLGREPAALLPGAQGRNRCSATSQASTRGSPACGATSGRPARTSARSRSTTTTARS